MAGATAYGYGASISALGANLLDPTPEASAGPAPDDVEQSDLVPVDLDTLAFAGTVGAKARTSSATNIGSELGSQYLNVVQGGPELPTQYNAQAYARTEGAQVVAEEVLPADTVTSIIQELDGVEILPALVAADLIHSEALVACEDGSPTVVGGGQVAGLGVLGASLTDTVDGTLNQVVDLGDTVLALLGGTLVVNEVIPSENGVSVNALRLTIPNIAEIIIGHTEVTGASCAPVDLPECSDGIDNDGDGKIDFPADPGCADPLDDDETDLIRTGGNGPALGLTIFGAGGLLALAAVRLRRSLFAHHG